MLYFLISMLIMLVLLDRALRIGRLESLRLETRFKLFALRDKLRRAAINGEAPQNRWFEYLDTSITKAIDVLPHINAWEALALLYSYADNKSVLEAESEMHQALDEVGNEELKSIYGEYLVCIIRLLVARHRTSGRVIIKLAHAMGRMANMKNRLAAIVTVAPETSTLLRHH